MKASKRLVIVSVLFMSILISTVFAQTESKYSFGHMQPVKDFLISPGEEVETTLYFYNIYGNRITHVSLEVTQIPENWEIEIEPDIHKAKFNVSGIIATVEENLYVRPSELLDEIPDDIPEGIEYIHSKLGYIGAQPVKIKIKVPEDEELGKDFHITISATGGWLGQTGTVEVKQGWDFEYNLKTIAGGEFFEEPVIIQDFQTQETPESEKSGNIDITGFIVSNSSFIGVIVILLILLVYFGFMRKK